MIKIYKKMIEYGFTHTEVLKFFISRNKNKYNKLDLVLSKFIDSKEDRLLIIRSFFKDFNNQFNSNTIELRDDDGLLHHDTYPAFIDKKSVNWLREGNVHRSSFDDKLLKPARYIFDDGKLVKHMYFINNKIHNLLDEPAVVWASGKKEWYKHGMRHRDNGPAIDDLYMEHYFIHNEFEYSNKKES